MGSPSFSSLGRAGHGFSPRGTKGSLEATGQTRAPGPRRRALPQGKAQERVNVQDGGREALGSATIRGSPLLPLQPASAVWGRDGLQAPVHSCSCPLRGSWCRPPPAQRRPRGGSCSVSVCSGLAARLVWAAPARPAHPALLLWTPGPRPAAPTLGPPHRGSHGSGLDVVKPPAG